MSPKYMNMAAVTRALNSLYKQHGKWHAVSKLLINDDGETIPPGSLANIAKGREPKNNLHRSILGLPPIKTVVARSTKQPRDLFAMSKKDLLEALENREEIYE